MTLCIRKLARISETAARSTYQDTGQFSKLQYLDMKLGKWPKFQKLHIYPLSTPGGSKLSLFLL